jgi:hypothetical protein
MTEKSNLTPRRKDAKEEMLRDEEESLNFDFSLLSSLRLSALA